VVLAHGLWTFGRQAFLTLRSPWSRDYGEGCVLGMAQLLAARGDYFPKLVDYPFLVANYPPVFIGIVALGQKLLGPSLAFPRLLGLAATLGVMAALYRGLRVLVPDRASAAAFASLFALPWFVTTWAGLARVDTLAILFSLAGLAIVLRHGASPRAWTALLCFWLAFFTKQNALLAPAAVACQLLLARDRRFLKALLAYALPLAAAFGLLVLATHGAAYRHLVPYTAAAEYEPGRMAESYLQFAVIAAPLLLLVAGALAVAPKAFASGTGRTLLVYFGLNLLALATIAKSGAAQNYFLELWAATLLLAGFAGRALLERVPRLAPWSSAFLLVAAAVASLAYPSLQRLPQALRRPANAEEFVELTRLVRETPGDVLSENLSLLVVNGRRVLLEPFGVLLIARQGLLQTDRLVRDCEAGRFPLVIVEHRMWQIPGFGACLERRYTESASLGPYQALRPRAVAKAR
jgi:hypothetical protein